MELKYTCRWKNNPRRTELFGRRCRTLTRSGMGTVPIEFENGERVTTPGRALKREAQPGPRTAPRGKSFVWDVYLEVSGCQQAQWLGRVMGSTSDIPSCRAETLAKVRRHSFRLGGPNGEMRTRQ